MKKYFILAIVVVLFVGGYFIIARAPTQPSKVSQSHNTAPLAPTEIDWSAPNKTSTPLPPVTTESFDADSFIHSAGIDAECEEHTKRLMLEIQEVLDSDEASPKSKRLALQLRDQIADGSLMKQYRKSLEEKFSQAELKHLKDIYQDGTVKNLMEQWNDYGRPVHESFHEISQVDLHALDADRLAALKELTEAQIHALDNGEVFENEGKGGVSTYQGAYFLKRFQLIEKDRSIDDIHELQAKIKDQIYLKEQRERFVAFHPFSVVTQQKSGSNEVELKLELNKRRAIPPKPGSFDIQINWEE